MGILQVGFRFPVARLWQLMYKYYRRTPVHVVKQLWLQIMTVVGVVGL